MVFDSLHAGKKDLDFVDISRLILHLYCSSQCGACCIQELEQSLELQERVSIHEVEESKNCHMNKLKAFNQEAISKLKGGPLCHRLQRT